VDLVAVNNFGDTRSGGLAGPAGLFIIVLMSIATVLLIRNMNKRLRRLPDSFSDVNATQREAPIGRSDADSESPGVEDGGSIDELPGSLGADGSTDAEVRGSEEARSPKGGDGAADRS